MATKAMIILIDGASADYLSATNAPHLHALVQTQGFYKPVTGQLPSVTNVNHARILTGTFPAQNGINGNIFFNRQTGKKSFIESPAFLNAPTIFSELKRAGKTSALLTVKGKIDQVFGTDTTYRINAEQPATELLTQIGAELPPAIDSVASGQWVITTAKRLIASKSPDFVYATTNDYVMHHFAPDTPQAHAFIRAIDTQIAAIHALEPERTIYVVADHGMNAKPTLIDLERRLTRLGFQADVLLPLADRYLKNHQYQESGTAYVYARQATELNAMQTALQAMTGVEAVLPRAEAVAQYHLDPDRIGDLVVLADLSTAFGLLPATEMLTNYGGRSHGSRHELTVPLFGITSAPVSPDDYQSSGDLFGALKTSLQF